MIRIDALPAFTDNYIWLLQDPETRQCAVVDPGDAQPVLQWLEQHPGWRLSDILITHHHADHIGGLDQLKQLTAATTWGADDPRIVGLDHRLADNQHLQVLGLDFRVLLVPGHTASHIAFYSDTLHLPILFSGDTLFAGGCGRLFEGTPAHMRQSLQRLARLPATTLVYCAHEYTLSNLRFAAAVEPDNPDIQARLQETLRMRHENQITLPSNLHLERQTNPFLRTDLAAVRKKSDERDKTPAASEDEVFARLREWKNSF